MNGSQPVREWIAKTAHPFDTVDPSAPLTDLRPLADVVGDATVVGIGASTRSAREPVLLAHRMVRFLVEEMGFRSVVLEGDDAKSAEIAEHLRTGDGDLRAMLADARTFWRIEEVLGLIAWLREHNEAHPDDPVRLVEPGEPPSSQRNLAAIEKHLAEGVVEWHERTGDKIVYWGGIAHTAVGWRRLVTQGTGSERQRNAGSYFQERFGSGYRSIGLTFGEGAMPFEAPPPPADFAEHALSAPGLPPYLLDLRADAPGPVRAWMDLPAKTRLIGPHYDPADDAEHHLSGEALAEWFDAVAHLPAVTPARGLRTSR
ncbi:erythromycin esterase family protein [Saccharopolyspora taberi]|uniref:Erythromycin esterase n=1 Tax=Saccharopolyspora taberi TaxID=60895 RepID=A0ABN3VM63_9PSEU